MNILYYDCFAGISGDMNLAAMIDLGVDAAYLINELSRLDLNDEFELKVTRDKRNGIAGTRVDVELKNQKSHHHHNRNLADIKKIIQKSSLSDLVKSTSLAIFSKIAEAEAKVHEKNLHEVHFHEVGATDSLVDIVGSAICYHVLDIDEVWCSAIELGGGMVECAHGMIPVPAPATVEILNGCPTSLGAVQKETTTPTGAAILAALVDRYPESPKMTMTKTGYGIGHRQSEIPNVLRVHLATSENSEENWQQIEARLLQCNIDDMTPEMLGVALEVLMDAGAMDVHFIPIMMKKGRSATCLSLLCDVSDEERFKELIFTHTTTLGVKSFPIQKSFLQTSSQQLEIPLGKVRLKHAIKNGKIIRSKPELEDCKSLAQKHNIPLQDVYLEIGKYRKT